MAAAETHVDAPPERCFEVLADPRAYSHWVVGSREIRSADPGWPAVGSRFRHTMAIGLRDHTVVEEMEPDHRLRLKAHLRPLGTAFVTLTIEPEANGSRVRMEEEPADRLSRALHFRLADRILHHRNIVSLERLKALAERTTPMPAGDLQEGSVDESGESRRLRDRDRVRDLGRGIVAGLVGGAAMSASTTLEMRLTRRPPSPVPGQALRRILTIDRLGGRSEQRLGAAAHFVVSGAVGGAWGAACSGVPGLEVRLPLLFAMATTPDVAVVPALGLAPPPWGWSGGDVARTVGHHAVFAGVAYASFAALESSARSA